MGLSDSAKLTFLVAPGGKLRHTIVWEEGRGTMLTSQVSGKQDHLDPNGPDSWKGFRATD
jgi:hypothetical protein